MGREKRHNSRVGVKRSTSNKFEVDYYGKLEELVEPYRVAISIDLEENSNFYVFDNVDVDVDVDVEELNVVLSSSGQTQVDEDDDINDFNVEDCVGADNESIEEEEDNSD
ncbi:hypothetical protein Peur_000821 [Populus x canadensis]